MDALSTIHINDTLEQRDEKCLLDVLESVTESK